MASERDRRAVRLALRRLYDNYPEALSSVMDDVIRNGKNWLKMLPPRSAKRVGRDTYAALLADYRNARELGWSRLDFFRRHAEEGCSWGGVYHGGTWGTEAVIREQQKPRKVS
jgi:hypothetical protein